MEERLEQESSQFAIVIKEKLWAHRDQTQPQWNLVDDNGVWCIMIEQWLSSEVFLLWGFFH